MLNKNDWVVYPGIGLYKVSEHIELSGKRFVRLVSENNPVVIIPEKDFEGSPVRNLCSLNDIKTAFRILMSPIRTDFPKKLPSLERVLSSKFKTGSIFEIAEMVKMLSSYKKHRKLSVNEMRFLDLGVKHLVEEASLVMDISNEESKQKIRSMLV